MKKSHTQDELVQLCAAQLCTIGSVVVTNLPLKPCGWFFL